jgi:hypothetical protein
MSHPSRSISIAASVRAALLLALLLVDPTPAGSQSPAPAPVVAHVTSTEPGQRVRVLPRVPGGVAITAERNRQFEGLLVDIDSATVTLRLDDGTVRRFERAEVESMKVFLGRSRGYGLLAGWLVSAPVALLVCRNEPVECAQGGVIGLVGGIGGAIIGWPRWQELPFP